MKRLSILIGLGLIAASLCFAAVGDYKVTSDGTIHGYDLILKRPYADVRAYGAVGDGTTDDTTAIQTAINAGRNVFLPNGHYKVSSSITLTGNAYFLGESARGVIFEPTAQTFPVFINNLTEITALKEVGNFTINYGIATSNVQATNPLARAFYLVNDVTNTYFPSNWHMKNIRVTYAYSAYYNTSYSWGMNLENWYTDYTYYGIYNTTSGGGFNSFKNVFVEHVACGWYLTLIGANLTNCGSNGLTVSSYPLYRNYFLNCYGLVINGFDVEGFTHGTQYGSLVQFSGCQGMSVKGLRTWGNTLATGASNEVYLVGIADDNQGSFTGELAENDSLTGTGTAAVLWIGGGSVEDDNIALIGARIKALTGATGTKYTLRIGAKGKVLNLASVIAATIHTDTGGVYTTVP